MKLYERVGCLHVHTTYSDGTAEHDEVAQMACEADLDYCIVTDHNVYAGEYEGWYGDVLLLVGEEIHNPAASQMNHYLAFGVGEELADCGHDPQALIDAVRRRGGIGFIAHPHEHSGAMAGEPEIDWVDWDVTGYDGIEVWNYMSEFKACADELASTLLYTIWPKLAIRGPFPETLVKWDECLAEDKVWAIGGVDAHGTTYRLGPIRRQVFGYRHLFQSLRTHVFLTEPWSGDPCHDGRLIYRALAEGRGFIAYDGLADARGFRFVAEHRRQLYTMGDEMFVRGRALFHVRLPHRAHIRLMLNGHCVAEAHGTELQHAAHAPGAYRVEAYRPYLLRERSWILSNPILVRT